MKLSLDNWHKDEFHVGWNDVKWSMDVEPTTITA